MPDLHLSQRFISATRDSSVQLRTAKLEGRDHLVVPVIAAIGDSVIRPLHSDGPELVPAAELQVVPAQWNGRPVVSDHPDDGLGSANNPSTLAAYRYGYIFNSRYEDGKLKQDLYLDVARAKEVGCEWVIEDFKAGKMVEVSVGCWVSLLKAAGISPTGIEYQYKWSGIIADHLAVGLNGKQGACSVDMGCGALRTAAAAVLNGEITMPSTLTSRLVEALRVLAGGKSDVELREQLSKALRATEPGFEWVMEVFTKRGGGEVVYSAYPENRPIYYRRSYTLSGDEITLADDRVEVEQSVDWKPISRAAATTTAEQPAPTVAAACECQKHRTTDIPVSTTDDGANPGTAVTTSATATEGDALMPDAAAVTTATAAVGDNIKALVGRLIACEASPFTDADRPKLEAWPETTLTDLDKTYAEIQKSKETPVVETPEAKGAGAATKQPTAEEWLATAPKEVQTLVSRFQAAEAQTRAQLVAQISKIPTAAAAYPTDVLNAMSTDDLQRLARVLNVSTQVDHSGRGLAAASVAVAGAGEYPKAPSIYDTTAKEKAN